MAPRRYAYYQGTATNEPGASYYDCATVADLPGNGVSGDMAYVRSTNTLYFNPGSGWIVTSSVSSGGNVDPVVQITEEDVSWPKKYFDAGGILTGLTKKFGFFTDAPSTPTVVSSSWTQTPGRFSSAAEGLCYYDLGAVFSKVLVWISGLDPSANGGALMLSHNAPVTDVPDGYAIWKDTQQRLYAQVGGAFNQIGAAVTIRFGAGVGWGFYCEPNIQKQWVRVGAEQPSLWLSRTDGTYTNGFRYASFFAYGGSTGFDSTTQIWAG